MIPIPRSDAKGRPTNRSGKPTDLFRPVGSGRRLIAQHYLPALLDRIEKGEIDPSFVITHRASLEDGPGLYKTFRGKQDGCIKVVLKP